jgi:hypothetical protein
MGKSMKNKKRRYHITIAYLHPDNLTHEWEGTVKARKYKGAIRRGMQAFEGSENIKFMTITNVRAREILT